MQLTDFSNLTFDEISPGHFQAKKQFGQYQLSVVLLPGAKHYEVAIFDDDMFVQLPGIHPNTDEDDSWSDDVIAGLEPLDVTSIMRKLYFIEGATSSAG